MRAFPSLATQRAMQRARVRYVVVDAAWSATLKAATPSDPGLASDWPLAYRSTEKLIYRVP